MVVSDKDSEKKPSNLKTLTFGDLTWVDIVQPTRETTNYLAGRYKFHPMDLDDAISLIQLSKIEEYPQYLFVILHLPVYDKKTRVSSRKQWSVFIGDNYIVTMHPSELKAPGDLFYECETSEDARRECLSQGSGYLLYQILDRALDAYFPVLDKILNQIDGIEDKVFSEEIEAAQELSMLRRDIITQRRVMFPTRTTLTELEKKLKRFSKTDLTIFFSDLMDHMNKICETLDESTEIIDVFKDADYLQSSYHANRRIRLVAIMLAVMLPLVAVFGLYSAYVFIGGSATKNSLLTFIILLVVAVVIIGITVFSLRRRHLI